MFVTVICTVGIARRAPGMKNDSRSFRKYFKVVNDDLSMSIKILKWVNIRWPDNTEWLGTKKKRSSRSCRSINSLLHDLLTASAGNLKHVVKCFSINSAQPPPFNTVSAHKNLHKDANFYNLPAPNDQTLIIMHFARIYCSHAK